MFGKIISDTFIAGTPVKVGEVFELDDATFAQLKRCKRIEECAAPEEHIPEPVKPKIKKVS